MKCIGRVVLFFAVNASNEVLCDRSMDDYELAQLKDAIEDLYYFEFVIGRLYCNLSHL